MFTGIIEEVGEIREIKRESTSFSLEIGALLSSSLHLGDSVATDGVCLTVTEKGQDSFKADIMPETLKKTNLKGARIGTKVNVERALTLNKHLGGHLLQGHVDTTSPILKTRREGEFILFTIPYEEEYGPYLIPQGSVAIDGISLTVADLGSKTFTISLIPHTLSQTTLVYKGPGDDVNIEFDLMGKYIYRILTYQKGERGTITENYLKEHGFF